MKVSVLAAAHQAALTASRVPACGCGRLRQLVPAEGAAQDPVIVKGVGFYEERDS
jgi:predicted nucleic acid-binding Zn ribbon protein